MLTDGGKSTPWHFGVNPDQTVVPQSPCIKHVKFAVTQLVLTPFVHLRKLARNPQDRAWRGERSTPAARPHTENPQVQNQSPDFGGIRFIWGGGPPLAKKYYD